MAAALLAVVAVKNGSAAVPAVTNITSAPMTRSLYATEVTLPGVVTQGELGPGCGGRARQRDVGVDLHQNQCNVRMSLDGVTWDEAARTVAGNEHADTAVARDNGLAALDPIHARFVRIEPTACVNADGGRVLMRRCCCALHVRASPRASGPQAGYWYRWRARAKRRWRWRVEPVVAAVAGVRVR